MIDCYFVYLIKLIVMIFYLFIYVVLVFLDESNENIVIGGSIYLLYFSLFELFSGSLKSNLIFIDFLVFFIRKLIIVVGRSLII